MRSDDGVIRMQRGHAGAFVECVSVGSLIQCMVWWLVTLTMAWGWKQMVSEVPSYPTLLGSTSACVVLISEISTCKTAK